MLPDFLLHFGFLQVCSLTSEFHSPASCWSSKMTFGLLLVFISQRGRWESCGRLHRPLTCEPAPVWFRQWDSLKTSGTPEPIWCSIMGFSDVIQVTGNFGKPHTPATSYMVDFYFHTHPINEPIDLFSYHNKTMSLEKTLNWPKQEAKPTFPLCIWPLVGLTWFNMTTPVIHSTGGLVSMVDIL